MTIFGTVGRTCLAFSFRSLGRQRSAARAILPVVGRAVSTSNVLAATSSSFTAPEPPSSKGVAVYSDIKISDSLDQSSDSFKRNHDPQSVFVVNGASRGIGLQFVKSLIDRTEGIVVACCRSPSTATGLKDFISSQQSLVDGTAERIHVIELDVENQESIEVATSLIKDKFNRVDLLVNVVGILGDARSTPGPERTISKLERDWLEKTMAVNVIGPMMVSKELAPLMKSRNRKTTKNKEADTTEERPISVIANLSARVGSISDNELGGWYSYRFSKAALNQATRTMSHELKRQGTWAIALHPGTTDTDLSKPFQRNVQEGRLFPVDFTVGQLLDVIDSMKEENSGGLYDWAGKAIPF